MDKDTHEAISGLNSELQGRTGRLNDISFSLEIVLQTILQFLPQEKECRETIIKNLKMFAENHDKNASHGRDNEFAMMLRRFGGTYP